MKSLNQLLRQPVKTIAGILLIALALAILIASAGQLFSTQITKANLSDSYSTVAIISDSYYWKPFSGGMTYSFQIADEEARAWKENVIEQRHDLFLGESFTEVYSAFVPGLFPDNYSQYETGNLIGYSTTAGNPYRCGMLEVSLTAIGSLRGEHIVSVKPFDGDWQYYSPYIYMLCTGTVESVVGLEKGFKSPIGKTIVLCIKACSESELENMALEVGQRYLLYGMNYTDMINENTIYEIDGSNVIGDVLGEQLATNLSMYEELFGPVKKGLYDPKLDDLLTKFDCYMTVFNPASVPTIYDGELRADLREYNTYAGERQLMTAYVSAEEFMEKYSVPTIVRLEGTAEEYIHSEAGAPWKQALADLEIHNHGFPVLAVDKINYQMAFAREDARIVEGRDFTEEE